MRTDIDVLEQSFTRFGGEAAGTAARRFFGGDRSAFPEFLQFCLPLYSTEAPDPDVLARTVLNTGAMDHFSAGEAQTMNLSAGLGSARCPVLVLGGELDPVMPAELVAEVAAALPSGLGRFEILPGVSHVQVAGSAAATVVREFLAGP